MIPLLLSANHSKKVCLLTLLFFVAFALGCNSSREVNWDKASSYVFSARDYEIKVGSQPYDQKLTVLVLSGGGPNGAWGAGFLKGWRESGNRPQFDVVTGVSTGALIAPAAFLGRPEDDEVMQTAYTQSRNEDIFDTRFFLLIPFSNSIYSTRPLEKYIAKVMPDSAIDLIAEEGRKGRRLYVGSCNLDQGRLVVWDLTKIAMSDDPKRYQHFRDIVLASASIPILFPPVFINKDMHVDGGTRASLFIQEQLLPPVKRQGVTGDLYIIVNGQPGGIGQTKTNNFIIPIAKRSLVNLIDALQVNNLYKVKLVAENSYMTFNLAYIPPGVPQSGLEFEPKTMTVLYNSGYEQGKKQTWYNEIPKDLE